MIQLVRKGIPAVVVATEQFGQLARVIMKSQDAPASLMIMIQGNPEFIADDKLMEIADCVLEQAAQRLTQPQ